MKIRRYQDIITYGGIITAESRERLSRIPCPKRIACHHAPKDLNGITLAQLIALWQIGDESEILGKSLVAVFGYDTNDRRCLRKERRMAMRVHRVRIGAAIGWCNFIQSEMLRIKAMWKRCEVPLTGIEKAAMEGMDDFGFFSIIDAYARRQGYLDPDDVLKVGWLKIWQSLLKDAETIKYQRRKDRLIEMQYGNEH